MKIFLSICLLFGMLYLHAGLKVGASFPTMHLRNAYGKKSVVPAAQTHYIVFAAEKKVSLAVTKIFRKRGAKFLRDHRIQYLVDISRAPSLVVRFVVIPKMKKYPFNIIMITRKHLAKSIDRRRGKVTLIELKNKQIRRMSFVNPSNLPRELH